MDRRWADLWKRARFQATLFISLSQFALVSHISFGNRDTRASLGENVKIDFHILTLLALVVQRIGHKIADLEMEVRFLPRAQKTRL